MTRDEILKRMLKMKPIQQKTMKPMTAKRTKPLDKIVDEDRIAYRKRVSRS